MATPEVGEEAFAVVVAADSDVTWYGDEREAVEDALAIVNTVGGRLAVVKIIGWVAPPVNSARYSPVNSFDKVADAVRTFNDAVESAAPQNGHASAPERKNSSEAVQTPATVVSEAVAKSKAIKAVEFSEKFVEAQTDWTRVAHPFERYPGGLSCRRCDRDADDPLHGKSYHADRQADLVAAPLAVAMVGESLLQDKAAQSLPFDAPSPRAPKHPAFRGVDLPAHWNITATDGDAGPSTSVQHGMIMTGFAATNTKMEPTLKAIVADDVTLKALNYGTAEAILKILNSIKR
jgi:hypothetical protein